jgi:hypothetical protein
VELRIGAMASDENLVLREMCLLMIELRRQFGGDLDCALILLMLINKDTTDSGSMSVSALASFTGIPRESARRKLEEMKTDRQVVRGDNGHWSISAGTRETLNMLFASVLSERPRWRPGC